MSRPRGKFWVYPASVVVALLFGLLPLPEMLAPFRPYWLALVLAYWLIETPDRLGLPSAFGIGLLADLLFGSLLGEQALRLVVLAFVLQRFRARLRFFPLSQQALTVGLLLALDLLIAMLLHWIVGVPALPWRYAWSILPGVLLWPPLFVLLDKLRMARRDD